MVDDIPTSNPTPTGREQLHALLVALVCAVVYLGPSLLPGRCLVPYPPEYYEPMRSEALHDGMAAAELGRGNVSMGDKYNQSLMWDRVIQQRFRAGEFPLWTRDIGGGAVFPPQMGQPYQPWNLLLFAVPSTQWYGYTILLQLVLIGWFAYRFFRRVDCRHAPALFGIVVVLLGLWMQGRVHQNVVISAALPLFLMLSCVHDMFGGRRVSRAIGVFAIGAGLTWSGGFAPVSLQITYLCCGFAVLLAVARRHARPLVYVCIALALGGSISLAQMGPTLLAAAESAREQPAPELLALLGADVANLASAIWPDLLFWPDPNHLSGKPSLMALLWVDGLIPVPGLEHLPQPNYTEMAFSVGAIATVGMAGLWIRGGAAVRERGWFVGFFAVAALLGIGLASGATPFLELSAIVPGARSGDLRRFFFVAYVGLAVLATLGVDRVARSERAWPPVVVAAIIAIASAWLLPFGAGDEAALTDRYAVALADAYSVHQPLTPDDVRGVFADGEVVENGRRVFVTTLRSLLLVLLAAIALWRVRRWTVAVLALLAAIELLHAGAGNRLAIPAERVEQPPTILAPLLDATGDAARGPRPRVMTFLRRDERPSDGFVNANYLAFWGVEHMGAYNPLPKRRMEQLWLAIEPNAPAKESILFGGGGSGVDGLRVEASLEHPMLDVLGIEWILASHPCRSSRLVDRTPPQVVGPFKLYERSGAMPRATFVDRAVVVEDEVERLALLGAPEHTPSRVVVLEVAGAPAADGDGVVDAEVRVTLHSDEVVRVEVETDEPGYLRLADPYDAGWTASTAAGELEVFAADHYFRAVHLAAGRHVVEFRYDGLPVRAPRWLALIGLLAAIGLMVAGSRR